MIHPSVRAAVLRRANNSCERCGQWLDTSGGYYSLQHRRARGMGGSKRRDTDQAANLAALCGSATTPGGCHQAVESNPVKAIEDGWRVPQGHDPSAAPILHWELGRVLLLPNYEYEAAA